MKFKRAFVILIGIIVLAIIISLGFILKSRKDSATIASGQLRETVFSLVSSAENSTIDYQKEYSYIEDIGDGRGYTAGVIGFTSANGDLLRVVKYYVKLAPKNNVLKKYISPLTKVEGTDSHQGLGKSFVLAWKKAAKTKNMIKAQNNIINKEYMIPAIKYAKKDGLDPLGQYIYYDALVVHGPGEDKDSFQGMRKEALKRAKSPASGGKRTIYLENFLKVRRKVMLKEEAHQDLSRVNVQKKFIQEKKFYLQRPLKWKMYGDNFELK